MGERGRPERPPSCPLRIDDGPRSFDAMSSKR